MSRDEADQQAQAIVELVRGGAALPSLAFSEDLPDVLNAVCDALSRNESGVVENRQIYSGLHELVVNLDWPQDEFDEKAELLARIAHLAWSRSLGRGNASETLRWEEGSVKHLLAQESGQQLVRVPAPNWSPALRGRFLADRAIYLGLCVWLRREVNSRPRRVFELASLMYGWLSTYGGTSASREEAYLLTELAVVASHGARTCGRYTNSQAWLGLAEKRCRKSKDPFVSRTRVEYARLALWYETRRFQAVFARVSNLIARFAQLGLQENVAKTTFLRALTLKELNREEEALGSLLALETDPVVIRQPWLHGRVLTYIAELYGRAKRPDTALRFMRKADILLGDGGPIGQADGCAVTAEILRDQGNVLAAAQCYRRAVEIYTAADSTALAAYLRVILAETLLAIGKDEEAVEELLAVLPTIERENLLQEGIAAVGLLKTSLTRRRLDPAALKALRESLDRSRQVVES